MGVLIFTLIALFIFKFSILEEKILFKCRFARESKKSMFKFRPLMFFFSKSPYQKTVTAKILYHFDLSLLIDRVLNGETGIKIGFFQNGPIFAKNGPNS